MPVIKNLITDWRHAVMLRPSLISTVLTLMTYSSSALANDVCSPIDMDTDTTSELPETTAVDLKSDDLFSRNIFVEFGGPSLGVGIGYDQRFKPKSVFGFRAGLSFTSLSWDDAGWFGAYDGGPYTDVDLKGLTIPLEANAIMGKRASKFELGIGATPCILHRHERRHWGWYPGESGVDVKDGTKINIFGSLNIGYRLQRKCGFFLRAGFTFIIGDLKYSPFDGLLLIPNIALGYTIR